jgi:urea transport system substrate-binding protein
LAAEELNTAEGLTGRALELVVIDAGQPPGQVARRLAELRADGSIDALVGMHTSAVRRAVVECLAGAIPYIYTPPYEGNERSDGVFLLGSTPDEQLLPALRWLVARGVRRWALIGNDYVWPRRVNALAHAELHQLGGRATAEMYLPFGSDRTARWLPSLLASRPQGLLVTLIGEELIRFERQLSEQPRLAGLVQLCLALDENVLLGFAEMAGDNVFSVMEYFAQAPTPEGRKMAERYRARFGPQAPLLSVYAQSCYEGIHALAALARRARSLEVEALQAASDGTLVEAGRGPARMRGRSLRPRVYLAQAEGGALRVLRCLNAAGR